MKKDEIHLTDIARILFGQAPPMFLLETFIRTLIIYILLLITVRWMGKRMSGQLTIMEMVIMLLLGAIVAVPMQVPDRGLLQGVLLLAAILIFQRGLTLIGFRSTKFEDWLQGKPAMLVKDGVLQIEDMQKNRISHQQLFSELRQEDVHQLGMVDRLYLEAEGAFSIFQAKEPKPGLSILPPDDEDILKQQPVAKTPGPELVQLLACVNCGTVRPEDAAPVCAQCQHDVWVNAIN